MATDEKVTEHSVQSEGLGGEAAGTGKKRTCAFGCKLKRQNLCPFFGYHKLLQIHKRVDSSHRQPVTQRLKGHSKPEKTTASPAFLRAVNKLCYLKPYVILHVGFEIALHSRAVQQLHTSLNFRLEVFTECVDLLEEEVMALVALQFGLFPLFHHLGECLLSWQFVPEKELWHFWVPEVEAHWWWQLHGVAVAPVPSPVESPI